MRFTFRRVEGREAEITAKFLCFPNISCFKKDTFLDIRRMLWALSEPFNCIKLCYIWMQFVEQETSLRRCRETFYYTRVIWRAQTPLGHQTSFQGQKRIRHWNCNSLIISTILFAIVVLLLLLALEPPLRVVFYSPLVGFSLLACEVSWSHTTTRHSR